VDKFFVAKLWIPGSDFRHLSWGLVSTVIDGLPLDFVAVGEHFPAKGFPALGRSNKQAKKLRN
jgi:hypothetical protein